MAAPTPVSALVHSSTLVTAGVYLLIRFNEMFSFIQLVRLGALGGLTMLMARARALKESDIKKIIALSTLSQLGVMVTALPLVAPPVIFFHLVVHAFFKALLFISAGHTIHNISNYQDLRRIGGRVLQTPLAGIIMVVTKISLCGLPFFSAFFSKEMVLEGLAIERESRFIIFLLIWIGVLLTVLYSIRFIKLVFLSSFKRGALFYKKGLDLRVYIAFAVLVLPSISIGKIIWCMLRVEGTTALATWADKIIVLNIFVTRVLLSYVFINPQASSRKRVNFYIWGLPF